MKDESFKFQQVGLLTKSIVINDAKFDRENKLELNSFTRKKITYWKSKLKDIHACEASRWHAVEYFNNQTKKNVPVFDLVVKNSPFCCIRKVKDWPGFAWVKFRKSYDNDPGVSWNYWTPKTPDPFVGVDQEANRATPDDVPLKQDVGDAWFEFEERRRQLHDRLEYFENLFFKALQDKYFKLFQGNRLKSKMLNLVINGRNYLIGLTHGAFNVIAYPENVITKVL